MVFLSMRVFDYLCFLSLLYVLTSVALVFVVLEDIIVLLNFLLIPFVAYFLLFKLCNIIYPLEVIFLISLFFRYKEKLSLVTRDTETGSFSLPFHLFIEVACTRLLHH